MMYTVNCKLYTVPSLYTLHCTLYTVQILIIFNFQELK